VLVSDTGLPPDAGDAPPKGDGIARGRLRRTAPLAALSARTAGEAVVVGLRSKLTGADSTEFYVRTAERYAERRQRYPDGSTVTSQVTELAMKHASCARW